VGNRAQGDRLSMLVSHGQLKLAAALLLLSPFVPLLFMGEEWGSQRPFLFFVEHEDPALNQAVKKGRLKEFADFGWQPQEVPDPAAPDTFLSSQLDWSRLDSIAGQDLSSWYRQLIALRKEHFGGEQTLAEVQVECDEAQGWLSMKRGALRVCAYFGGARHRVFTRQQRVLLGTGRSHEEEGVYVLDGPGVVVFDAA
jgi:maltooligosyltrehalose trehalohydrolase